MKNRMCQVLFSFCWTLGDSLAPKNSNRRTFIETSSSVGGVMLSSIGTHISRANAALPIAQAESETIGAKALRFMRPKPPRVIRPKLNKDFAVLLMRTSYNATDELNCVAMDQFQRDFFLIRQAEYQPYVNYLGPGIVQQGDLTDPYYFDFISFAQYLAINREISIDPPFLFEEKQPRDVGEGLPFEFVNVVVRRDPSITDDRLAPEHSRMVGTAILNYIDETLGETEAGLPKFSVVQGRPIPEQVLSSFSQLVNIFIINGFAWEGNAQLVSTRPDGSSEFALTLVSPATLWGSRCLQQQRSRLDNHFLLKTATQLAQRLGYFVYFSSVKFDGTNEITCLKLR